MQPGSILRKLSRVSFWPNPRASLLQAHLRRPLRLRLQKASQLLYNGGRRVPTASCSSSACARSSCSRGKAPQILTLRVPHLQPHGGAHGLLPQHVPRDLEHALHGLHDLTAPRAPLAAPIPQHGARLLLAPGDAPRH